MTKSKLLLVGLGVVAGSFLFSAHSAHAAYTPKPGDLIKTQTKATVYLVEDNLQRVIVTALAYQIRYHNDFSLVKIVTPLELASFANGIYIGGQESHPDGTLIVYSLDNPEVFVLDHGFKKSLGHRTDLSGVIWVGFYENYPTK